MYNYEDQVFILDPNINFVLVVLRFCLSSEVWSWCRNPLSLMNQILLQDKETIKNVFSSLDFSVTF